MSRSTSKQTRPIIDVEAVEVSGPRSPTGPTRQPPRAPPGGGKPTADAPFDPLQALQAQREQMAAHHRALRQLLAQLIPAIGHGGDRGVAPYDELLARSMQAVDLSLAASLASLREVIDHVHTRFLPNEEQDHV